MSARRFLASVAAFGLLCSAASASDTFNPRSADGLPPCDDYPAVNNLNPIDGKHSIEQLRKILPGPNYACWFPAANGSGGYVLSPQGVNRIGN
jgi:hypothetical protein